MHLVARDSNGNYVPLDHPDATVEQVSGELRRVHTWNDGGRQAGHIHEAETWVPVEHAQDIYDKSLSNKGRDTELGDRAWDHAEIDDEHTVAPGADHNQLWRDEIPEGVTVAKTHPQPASLPEGVRS